jgi:hypothetical protein
MKLYIPADGKYEKTLNIFEQGPNTITVRLLHNKRIETFPEQDNRAAVWVIIEKFNIYKK